MYDIASKRYIVKEKKKFLGSEKGRGFALVNCILDSFLPSYIVEYGKEIGKHQVYK